MARNKNSLYATSIKDCRYCFQAIFFLLAICLVMSCTPARQQTSSGDLNPTSTGAVVGAALGAAGGAIIGSATGDAGPGLAIGAAGGALTGGVIGRGFQQQDEEILKQREIIARQGATIDDQGRQINELRRNMADGAGDYSMPSTAPTGSIPMGSIPTETMQEQDMLGTDARFQMTDDVMQQAPEPTNNALPRAALPPAAGTIAPDNSWQSSSSANSATADTFVDGRFEIPAKNRPSVERVEQDTIYDGNPQAQPFLGSVAEQRADLRADARDSVRARLGFPTPEEKGMSPILPTAALDSSAATSGQSSIESEDLMPMLEDAQKTQLPPANMPTAGSRGEQQMLAARASNEAMPAGAISAPRAEVAQKPAIAPQSFGAASMEPPVVTPSPTGKATISLPTPARSIDEQLASAKPIRLSKGTRLINPGKREIRSDSLDVGQPVRLGRDIGASEQKTAFNAPAKPPVKVARNIVPTLPSEGAVALEDELPLAVRPAQSQKALDIAAVPSSGVRLGDLEKHKPSPRAKQFTVEPKEPEKVAKKVTKPEVAPTTKKAESTKKQPPKVEADNSVNEEVPVVTIVQSDDTAAPLVPKDTNCMEGETEAERARSATSDSDKIFYYRRALRLCPKEPVYLIELGRLYSELGKTEDARFSFTKALELDPENEIAQDELSLLMLESDSNVY